MKKLMAHGAALVVVGMVGCAGDEPAGDGEETGETVQALSAQSGSIAAALESNESSLGGFDIDGIEPASLTVFHLHVTAKAKWQATTTTELTWDGDKVRQGQMLNVGRKTSATGVIKVLWTLTGTLRPLDLFDVDVGSIPIAADVTNCEPRFQDNGPLYVCTASSPSIPLKVAIAPLDPYVDFSIDVQFGMRPDPGTTTRTLMFGDEQGPQRELDVTSGDQTDALAMPCNKPAGTTLDYVLDPVSWTPLDVISYQQPKFTIGTIVPVVPPFVNVKVDIFSAPFGDPAEAHPSFTLTGGGNTQSLGELQANNVNPTVSSAGPFSGVEGSPVELSAATTSACPITSYVWQFSNGTTSYGPTPQRTFGDDAVFDGQLTVTDMTNLSGTGSLTVNIGNVAPIANAGPNTSGAWGTPIALTGQAVDPGTDDQATLSYAWNFGDGTPGAGGASVTHAYAAPGDFVATLTVCDDHVCDTDATAVHVRKRTTAVAYTGTNVGTFSAPASLAGSIVDEFGQPVVNGALAFNLAAAAAGSANTNSAGNASRTLDITLPAGTYPISVAYAGNGFYDGGSSAELFDVSRMASSLSYTGAVSGGANKTVNLSAKVVDALNRPLAGKLVTFQLGTQTATATTASTGIAATTLKLDQKNASYPLTTSWAGDATQYTGASASVSFSIGGK